MSKVPKEMGKRCQEELQKALNQWTECIEGGAKGYYQEKKTQKIEREK